MVFPALEGAGFARSELQLAWDFVTISADSSLGRMEWMRDDALTFWGEGGPDYVLTENGGLHSSAPSGHVVGMNVGEKGVAWRRLRIKGTPGHGSRPFRSDNALVTAAAVVQRLSDYRPPPQFHELWRNQVAGMDLDDETRAILLDPHKIEDYLDAHPSSPAAGHFYSCTHTTFSPNVVGAEHGMKTNVIPDQIDINVDIRTLPGEGTAEVQAHLDQALGDLAGRVDVEIIMNDPASISRVTARLFHLVFAVLVFVEALDFVAIPRASAARPGS